MPNDDLEIKVVVLEQNIQEIRKELSRKIPVVEKTYDNVQELLIILKGIVEEEGFISRTSSRLRKLEDELKKTRTLLYVSIGLLLATIGVQQLLPMFL